MITILLTVSRADYLERVITHIELLECRPEETNLLCIVDGDDALYVRARNLVNDLKFNQRLTVKADVSGNFSMIDVNSRRIRIAEIHNQARTLIAHTGGFVFSVEDDTLVPRASLQKLLRVALSKSAHGIVQGVELGRWGVPYVGAWTADDVYNPTQLTSLMNISPVPDDLKPTPIDAGGLYCTLIRADLYKQHVFTCKNGLGPDVNLGLEARRLGYENFIVWQVPCTHLTLRGRSHIEVKASDPSKVVTLTKESDTKWLATS